MSRFMRESADSGTVGGLVPRELLARLEERIGGDLQEAPPTLDSERARRELGELLRRAGSVTHYELLNLSVGATTAQVTAAFIDLARRVHPSLAGWVNLPEAVLRLLFEHAVHAYLVLSDPVRRKSYDRDYPATADTDRRSPEELADVRREIARRCFRRAQSLYKTEQYHYVVELLRDSVQWDPRPEALALLADAQAKNPHWRQDALDNLQQAIRAAPAEMSYRLKLAQLLEEMGRPLDAIQEYRSLLEKVPNQPAALEALERLGSASTGSEKKGGWFRGRP
jgi:tetratricopeptide (TPR) repeat protein